MVCDLLTKADCGRRPQSGSRNGEDMMGHLRRLIGIRAAADDKTWLERAKRQRYVSYLMAGLVGTIGFLMSSKPVLW